MIEIYKSMDLRFSNNMNILIVCLAFDKKRGENEREVKNWYIFAV